MSSSGDDLHDPARDALELEIEGAFPGRLESDPAEVCSNQAIGGQEPRATDARRPAPLARERSRTIDAGSVLGDFRLLAVIGEGGMGRVWVAEQLSLGRRRVAVKLVRPDRVTERSLEYFQREARAGGRLNHPGIVAVLAYGEADGLAWLATELVAGGRTLRELIEETSKRESVPPDHDRRVARLVAQIASAMQAAHDAGVIHRDLKPQNVLISAEGAPKLTDFGLARITDESALSESGELAGTWSYMSPEQIEGRRTAVDRRTDVFSLGVILYELLALRRPFLGDTSHQIAGQILAADPTDLQAIRSRIPRELVVIAGKALEKTRERRYQTMGELAGDLQRFLDGEPIQARPPTRGERLAKWIARHPTWSAAGAVAMALFGVIAGLLIENVRARGAAEREAVSVKRLSARQDLEDLIAAADALWPAHPELVPDYERWMRAAEALVAGLPTHRAQLRELERLASKPAERARATPDPTDPERHALAQLRARIAARRAALGERRGERAAPLPEVDPTAHPTEPAALDEVILRRVHPARDHFGDERTGLALAQHAFERAAPEHRARAASTLAWALFALGRDEEALDAAYRALDEAAEFERESFERRFIELETLVSAWIEPGALEAEATALLALDRELADRAAALGDGAPLEFPPEAEQARWWHGQLGKLIVELEALRDEEVGLLAAAGVSAEHGWSIPLRHQKALELGAGFAPGGAHERRWAAALPELRRALPGLREGAWTGLVPIGRDPASGLHEFWMVQSGDEPLRDGEGRLSITGESGIVLVLLPRATTRMGSQPDPAAHHFDPESRQAERPVHVVTLGSFLCSKYELTQGQWRRLTGADPSDWRSGATPETRDWTLPVERVDWTTARRVLAWLGLALPSEARWEHACRAGSEGAYSFPFEEFERHANVSDESNYETYEFGAPSGAWNDGFAATSPVGSFRANAFGLHDLHGNVREWCLDGYDPEFYGRGAPEDPIAPEVATGWRVCRGGSCFSPPSRARSASRDGSPVSYADGSLGCRPVLDLGERFGLR